MGCKYATSNKHHLQRVTRWNNLKARTKCHPYSPFLSTVITVHEEQMLPSRVKKVPMGQLNSLALKQNVRDVNQENFVQKTGLMKPLETAQQVSSVDVMLQSMNQLTVSLVSIVRYILLNLTECDSFKNLH